MYLKENQELLRQVRIIIKNGVENMATKMPLTAYQDGNPLNFDIIKANLGESISKFLYQKTAKRPLVIPVILSV